MRPSSFPVPDRRWKESGDGKRLTSAPGRSLFLDIFGSRITPEIRDLAAERILAGGNLATRRTLDQATKKLVLLIVSTIAPYEVFSLAEAAILYGIHRNTVSKRQQAGNHPKRLNVGK
jgi:hypothetical protein